VNDRKMTLMEHLDEFRKRLIRCVVAALIGTTIACFLYDPFLFNIIKGPLDALAGRTDNPFAPYRVVKLLIMSQSSAASPLQVDLHILSYADGLMIQFKAAIFAGILLASPYTFLQIWYFVAAGLTAGERRAVRIFLPVSLVLFLLGVLLAYVVMIPMMVYFLLGGFAKGLVPMITLNEHVSILVGCCLGMGVVFQIPMLIMFLTSIGLVTPEFLVKKRRYAIVLNFIVAAMLPTVDLVSLFIIAIPMLILYEISIWISRIAFARRQKRLAH
jgi:sec-independent protein translocase protein TatC